MITPRDKNIFISFLNCGGYVLDFSSYNFDTFTMESVGVAVVTEYRMSKGKSLEAYLSDTRTSEADAMKLLVDLINHYEDSLMIDNDRDANNDNYRKYLKCKEVISRWGVNNVNFQIEPIKQLFNSEYISSQIDFMTKLQDESPTDAIGKAKELIESCCFTILDRLGDKCDNETLNLNNLVKKTFQQLKIMPNDISDDVKDADVMKKLLGNLLAISQSISALRNNYGTGHGKSSTFYGLQPRHAKLAVGASLTLVNFLWDSFVRTKTSNA